VTIRQWTIRQRQFVSEAIGKTAKFLAAYGAKRVLHAEIAFFGVNSRSAGSNKYFCGVPLPLLPSRRRTKLQNTGIEIVQLRAYWRAQTLGYIPIWF
jgi:hypothetical protein